MISVTRKDIGNRKIPTEPVNSNPAIVKKGMIFVPIKLAATMEPTNRAERYVYADGLGPPAPETEYIACDSRQ
jgi:hypothetical protein